MTMARAKLIATTLVMATLAAMAFALANLGPVQAANGSVAYTYDALGRLTTVNYDTNVCLKYTYDANGNRLSQTVSVSTNTDAVWGCFRWGNADWQ